MPKIFAPEGTACNGIPKLGQIDGQEVTAMLFSFH